jgi:heme exporter protein A
VDQNLIRDRAPHIDGLSVAERVWSDGSAIGVDRVCLTYGRLLALDEVTVHLHTGSTVALMGANGAGKSSLLAVAAGLVIPTSGSVTVGGRRGGGEEVASDVLGVLTHNAMLYDGLSGRENLALHARFRGVSTTRIDEVLELTALNGAADRLVGTFSHGMRRRLSLARTLLHDPRVLLLDEPFTGLDPEAQDHLSMLLEEIRGVKTVLFATHDVQRAREHADRVVVLDRGRIISDEPQRGDRLGVTPEVLKPPAPAPQPVERPTGVLRTALAFMRKDLTVEARTRSVSSAVLILAALLATVLAMAFEPLAGSPRAVSGILWVLLVFTALHGLARSFDEDFRDDALKGLLLSGVDPAGVYLGRLASTTVTLLGVALTAIVAVAVLFATPALLQVLPSLFLVVVLAVVGLAAVGGIVTVLSHYSRLGETLLPLLFLPLAVPVLLAGVESVAILLETGAVDGGWLRVLIFFAVGMSAASMMVFEYAVEG